MKDLLIILVSIISVNSMDSTSQLVRGLYYKKFTCGRTKTKSIISNVFLPITNCILKNDLSECNFVSIMIDASNHISPKIVAILIRNFLPDKGVKNNVLKCYDFPEGTALFFNCNYCRTKKKKKKSS